MGAANPKKPLTPWEGVGAGINHFRRKDRLEENLMPFPTAPPEKQKTYPHTKNQPDTVKYPRFPPAGPPKTVCKKP